MLEKRPVFLQMGRETPRDIQIADIFERTAEISGTILALASMTEFSIGTIIADHFAENLEKRNLMFSLFISANLSFASKRQILMHVLRRDYKEIEADYPDLEKRLKKLTEFRNRVAHSFPDVTDDYLAKKYTDRIRLVYYQKGLRKHLEITFAHAQTKIREFASTLVQVDAIRDRIERYPPP